jgi:hypothetical protein
MKKTSNKIIQNVFEQLKDLSIETGKATAKAINETFNPLDALMKTDNSSGNLKEVDNQKKNHTPLDFDNLQKKYQDKDKIAQEALRKRLFQMIRQSEQKIIQEEKQKEIEKKRQDSLKIVEKKLKEEEAYKEWKRSTLKIFAKMDAKNITKILENYSDNVVRDLIYEMKDALAAEVLSVMAKTNPERAAKITGAKYANKSNNSSPK